MFLGSTLRNKSLSRPFEAIFPKKMCRPSYCFSVYQALLPHCLFMLLMQNNLHLFGSRRLRSQSLVHSSRIRFHRLRRRRFHCQCRCTIQ